MSTVSSSSTSTRNPYGIGDVNVVIRLLVKILVILELSNVE